MIHDFLDKETKRMEEELNELKKKLSELEIKKQEDKTFIHRLKESIDRKYAGFTPYAITKEEDLKIQELKVEIAALDDEIKELQIEIISQEEMISEYKKILEVAKTLEEKYEKKR